jgi:hypothetical protein
MKIPEYMKLQAPYITSGINTCSLTGLSLLWGSMLGLISPWWTILTVLLLLEGFGSELRKRKENG